ncbi:hypothetical protein CWM52_15270 [Raoultella sp. T31]|nr:hypothetical protein CWM52_15270 [Raoultella sp. T31]
MTWINRQRGRSAHCINTQDNCNFIHSLCDEFSLYLTSGLPLSSSGQKQCYLPPQRKQADKYSAINGQFSTER